MECRTKLTHATHLLKNVFKKEIYLICLKVYNIKLNFIKSNNNIKHHSQGKNELKLNNSIFRGVSFYMYNIFPVAIMTKTFPAATF